MSATRMRHSKLRSSRATSIGMTSGGKPSVSPAGPSADSSGMAWFGRDGADGSVSACRSEREARGASAVRSISLGRRRVTKCRPICTRSRFAPFDLLDLHEPTVPSAMRPGTRTESSLMRRYRVGDYRRIVATCRTRRPVGTSQSWRLHTRDGRSEPGAANSS